LSRMSMHLKRGYSRLAKGRRKQRREHKTAGLQRGLCGRVGET
jgi:hypothetical protein